MTGSSTEKVRTLDEIDRALSPHRKRNARIVHCHGVFDVVHLGHLRYFTAAKALGDLLVVTLTSDRFVRRGPGRPFFSHAQRAEMLAALGLVDFVCIVDEATAIPAIRAIKPSFYVKGPDYRNKAGDVTGKIFDEEEAVRAVGGELAFTDEATFSSSQLINSSIDRIPEESLSYLRSIGARWKAEELITKIHQLTGMHVLVIGSHTEDLSESGPVRLANQCAALGAKVDLVIATRAGGLSSEATSLLAPGITPLFVSRDATDAENHPQLEGALQRAKECPATLVWDAEPEAFADAFRCELTKVAPFLAVCTGGVGHSLGQAAISRYPSSHFLCLDEPELRILLGRRRSPIPELLSQLRERNAYETALLCSPSGIWQSSAATKEQLPRFAGGARPEVSETLFTYGALLSASGLDPAAVAFIATAAGSIFSSSPNIVSPVDVAKFLTRLLKV